MATTDIFSLAHTCSSLIATHEFDGKPCSIGTKNCKHPLQWPINSIIQIKLNIRINTDAIFKNCAPENVVAASSGGGRHHSKPFNKEKKEIEIEKRRWEGEGNRRKNEKHFS